MANRGREYAENLVGALDRSAYGQQRDVAQNVYNTNWQNVQNQYRNLQDKLKLQQERANTAYAEGLVDAAENSFDRQRLGSANLANRGLAASGINNLLSQADTAQKGEDISNLLKNAGAISSDTADKLSQATSKYAQESSGLMGKLADTLANVGDAETAAQNRYNQTLAGIAGAMDEREANNALQAAQRAASRASSGASRTQKDTENELEEFYKRATINEVLSSPDMTDKQKENYLGIIFGIDNANDAVLAYANNVNATDNYNNELARLQRNANTESVRNRINNENYVRNVQNRNAQELFSNSLPPSTRNNNIALIANPNVYSPNLDTPPVPVNTAANALRDFENKGITYEDLAALLYGNR